MTQESIQRTETEEERTDPTPAGGPSADIADATGDDLVLEGAERASGIPADVTSPVAKLVYVSLCTMRAADVTDISSAIRIPQIRLLPVLDTLAERGHVEQDGLTFAITGGEGLRQSSPLLSVD